MSSELTTIYLGMELNSPVIVGACPLTIQPEQVRQFAIAGAGAITLPSIMQEQIVHAKLKDHDPDAAISQSGYQPQQDKYNGGVDSYLETIRTLKTRETIPIYASINAARSGEWIEYAEAIQSSGADALELNWPPIITHPQQSADEVESYLVEMVRNLCDRVSIPVAVKLNQRFTNLSSIAHKLQNAGADGLVVFSHLPEWDVSVDRLHWTIRWELSPIQSFGQVLEGVVRCRVGGLDVSLAASGGVRTGEDAVKAMIAGASAVMVTSEVYREGPDVIRKIIEGISHFLDASHFDSLIAFQQACPTPEVGPERLMRLEYVDPLTRSTHYYDPAPQTAVDTGDSYGHRTN